MAVASIAVEAATKSTEVELLLVVSVFVEVLPEDVVSTEGWMTPPCGVTVIMLPFFLVLAFLAAGSFDTAGSFDAAGAFDDAKQMVFIVILTILHTPHAFFFLWFW